MLLDKAAHVLKATLRVPFSGDVAAIENLSPKRFPVLARS